MKTYRIIALFSVLSLSTGVFSQSESKDHSETGIAIYGGGTLSKLQFDPFKDYVIAYNQGNAGRSIKELKYNPMGVGYEAGAFARLQGATMGFGFTKTKTLASTAEFAEGTRNFQFTNWTTEFMFGYQIGGLVMPYVSGGFSAMHIDSYFDYHGVKSYGGENPINGVYSSWKFVTTLGVRIEKSFGHFAPYLDFNYAFKMKEHYTGTYVITTNSTEDYDFSADPNHNADLTGTYPDLSEIYRNTRISLGLVIYIFKAKND